MQYQTKYEETHVKILFELERDEDGYPPEKWESLWAFPLGRGLFRIDNIPFYVSLLSCGDVVKAQKIGDEYLFESIIERSQNSTVRMIVYDTGEVENIRQKLMGFGCDVEKSGTPGFISINIPITANIESLLEYIELGYDDDLWDYEEATLRF